jgi:hypothetical protein
MSHQWECFGQGTLSVWLLPAGPTSVCDVGQSTASSTCDALHYPTSAPTASDLDPISGLLVLLLAAPFTSTPRPPAAPPLPPPPVRCLRWPRCLMMTGSWCAS